MENREGSNWKNPISTLSGSSNSINPMAFTRTPSPISIGSIQIDLSAYSAAMQENISGPCTCNHTFSIRGFTAEMRKKNINACFPFPPVDGDMLPPMEVPNYMYWKCQNCVRRMINGFACVSATSSVGGDGMKDSHPAGIVETGSDANNPLIVDDIDEPLIPNFGSTLMASFDQLPHFDQPPPRPMNVNRVIQNSAAVSTVLNRTFNEKKHGEAGGSLSSLIRRRELVHANNSRATYEKVLAESSKRLANFRTGSSLGIIDNNLKQKLHDSTNAAGSNSHSDPRSGETGGARMISPRQEINKPVFLGGKAGGLTGSTSGSSKQPEMRNFNHQLSNQSQNRSMNIDKEIEAPLDLNIAGCSSYTALLLGQDTETISGVESRQTPRLAEDLEVSGNSKRKRNDTDHVKGQRKTRLLTELMMMDNPDTRARDSHVKGPRNASKSISNPLMDNPDARARDSHVKGPRNASKSISNPLMDNPDARARDSHVKGPRNASKSVSNPLMDNPDARARDSHVKGPRNASKSISNPLMDNPDARALDSHVKGPRNASKSISNPLMNNPDTGARDSNAKGPRNASKSISNPSSKELVQARKNLSGTSSGRKNLICDLNKEIPQDMELVSVPNNHQPDQPHQHLKDLSGGGSSSRDQMVERIAKNVPKTISSSPSGNGHSVDPMNQSVKSASYNHHYRNHYNIGQITNNLEVSTISKQKAVIDSSSPKGSSDHGNWNNPIPINNNNSSNNSSSSSNNGKEKEIWLKKIGATNLSIFEKFTENPWVSKRFNFDLNKEAVDPSEAIPAMQLLSLKNATGFKMPSSNFTFGSFSQHKTGEPSSSSAEPVRTINFGPEYLNTGTKETLTPFLPEETNSQLVLSQKQKQKQPIVVENASGQKGSAKSNHRSEAGPSRSININDFCSMNRNPAEFTVMGTRNEYMINGKDLKMGKGKGKAAACRGKRNRARVVVDGRKRKRKDDRVR